MKCPTVKFPRTVKILEIEANQNIQLIKVLFRIMWASSSTLARIQLILSSYLIANSVFLISLIHSSRIKEHSSEYSLFCTSQFLGRHSDICWIKNRTLNMFLLFCKWAIQCTVLQNLFDIWEWSITFVNAFVMSEGKWLLLISFCEWITYLNSFQWNNLILWFKKNKVVQV